MAPTDTIFKAYDVRGLVPEQLDEAVAEAVGAAFVRVTGTAGGSIGAKDQLATESVQRSLSIKYAARIHGRWNFSPGRIEAPAFARRCWRCLRASSKRACWRYP